MKKMSEAIIEETVCEDRISELPEDLLVRILCLLPIKEAVTTMFLSKQWLLIWTMLPTLKYKDKKINERDENTKSIWCFLDKSLQFHKAHFDRKHVIIKLLIKLGSQCPTDADVGKWIAYAVERGVLILKLKLLWSTDPISLPKSLYSCETLRVLSLCHKILVDFPSFSCLSLPSLFRLNLFYVVYKDEASLVRLLSSCPVLEYLEVKRKRNDNVRRFTVKVPSLRVLWYENYELESDVEDEIDAEDDSDVEDNSDVDDDGYVQYSERCLVIDTPALLDLTIIDCSEDSYYLIESMPDLSNAYINVKPSIDCDKFITALSSVLSLELGLNEAVVNLCSIIKLSQLTKLAIYPHVSNWLEPLMFLLGNAPKLRELEVNCILINTPKYLPPVWNQAICVPTCLSSQLERLEWSEYGDSMEEKEFLTYLFANSKCLKTAKISVRSSCFDSVELRDLIFKELKDITRVSIESELLL